MKFLARLVEPLLRQMERPDGVKHRRLAADMVRLPGGLQGDVVRLPPVVKVDPGLEERDRAERQAPAQLDKPGLGRLPYPGDQRGTFAVVPRQRIADQLAPPAVRAAASAARRSVAGQ